MVRCRAASRFNRRIDGSGMISVVFIWKTMRAGRIDVHPPATAVAVSGSSSRGPERPFRRWDVGDYPRAFCSARHIAAFCDDATLKRIQVEGSWVGEKRLPGAAT